MKLTNLFAPILYFFPVLYKRILLSVLVLMTFCYLHAQQAKQPSLPGSTLEEKVAQTPNATPAIPRLTIPAYDWRNEVLPGVARIRNVSAYSAQANKLTYIRNSKEPRRRLLDQRNLRETIADQDGIKIHN